MSRTILARSLLQYTIEQLEDILTGTFNLRFDDGDLETDYKETLYSSLAWRFHKEFPNTPLLKEHHVKSIIKSKSAGVKTHLILLGNVMWCTYNTYEGKPNYENVVQFKDYLRRIVYEITSDMYNYLSYTAEKWVVSLDILDFLEVRDFPAVAVILDSLVETQESIDKAYAVLDWHLTHCKELKNNAISQAYTTGLVNKNQALQCLGPRGYLTDIDSIMFRKPIMRGYFEGMRSMHDSAIESRSGAKHLMFSKDIIKDAEYFSRRLQVLCQTVKNLHVGDCGTKEYIDWHIKPEVIENGAVTFKGDLYYLNGKAYHDAEGKVQHIKPSDKHLNDTNVRLRSVVAGCAHPDPYGVCYTCFGLLSDSVPEGTNIGHFCSTTVGAQIVQYLLSTKHHESSSVISGIVLPPAYRKHLTISKDSMSYLLADDLKNKNCHLIFKQKDLFGLTDIDIVDNINKLVISRISATKMIGVRTLVGYDSENPVYDIVSIPVGAGKRLASLSVDMLLHIKKYGHTLDDKGNVLISLDKWDFSKKLMSLPLKHYSMGDHATEIAKVIESVVTSEQDRARPEAPLETLYELYELVNEKLDVNLAVLEIIIYAAMAVDPLNNNYDLPKPWTTKGMGVASSIIPRRSLSGSMAYESVHGALYNPKSFFSENRPSHIMDVFLMPAQAVADNDS